MLNSVNENVVQLFTRTAKRVADKAAVTYRDQSISYTKLDQKSNQLANHLRILSSAPNPRIALWLERSPSLITGLLGILKSGGAYLPIDHELPDKRIQWMLKDARPQIILTQEKFLPRMPSDISASIVCIDKDRDKIASECNKEIAIHISDHDLAYIMYTSGSTGHPKGVMIVHAALSSFINTDIKFYDVSEKDRILQLCSISFDASVEEIFSALLTGGTLVLRTSEMFSDFSSFLRTCEEEALTVIGMFPSFFSDVLDLLENGGNFPSCVRLVTTGGEPVSTQHILRWQQYFKAQNSTPPRLVNVYGVTEATVASVWCDLTEFNLKSEYVPIGRPLSNTEVFVLDQNLNKLSNGETGELYIGGQSLARGYLNQPELTAEKFITNPYDKASESRLYRTGDLVRYLPDGNLEFVGRIDNQLKIYGFRIEPEEIERHIKKHPLVDEAIVVVKGDNLNQRKLVAYILGNIDQNKIKNYLKARLPLYMVPSLYIHLDRFPLNTSGKVDRNFLAGRYLEPDKKDVFIHPRTPLEKMIADIFRKILHLKKIGIHDDFFDMGGDSLKSIAAAYSLEKKLGEAVHAIAVFASPTIAEFAKYLEDHYPEQVARLSGKKLEPGDIVRIDQSRINKFSKCIIPLAKEHITPEDKNRQMIFILCSPRSGSTLLRVILSGHPDLFSPPELNLLSFDTLKQRANIFSGKHEYWKNGAIRAIMQINNCDAPGALTAMKGFEATDMPVNIFYRQLQQWIGNRLLIDKSTNYAIDPETLKNAENYFDHPHYIILSRHPQAMIQSFIANRTDLFYDLYFSEKHKATFSPKELAELVWIKSYENISRFLKDIPDERQCHIRFETLVTEPESETQRICRFLGINFFPEMLNVYDDSRKRMTDGLNSETGMIGDTTFHHHNKIDKSVAHAWEKKIKNNFISDHAWKIAKKLNYSLKPIADAVQFARAAGNKKPLFYIGPPNYAKNLSHHLDPQQSVYGLHIFGLQLEIEEISGLTVRAIAEKYLKTILTIDPNGPYILGAYCGDACIAYEIAQLLIKRNKQVSFLVLIDVLWDKRMLKDDLYNFIRNTKIFGSRYILNKLIEKFRDKLNHFIYRTNYLKAGVYRKIGRQLSSKIRDLLLIYYYNQALNNYQPTPYPGKAALFLSAERVKESTDEIKTLIKSDLNIYEIPGLHRNLLTRVESLVTLGRKIQGLING